MKVVFFLIIAITLISSCTPLKGKMTEDSLEENTSNKMKIDRDSEFAKKILIQL